MHEVPYQLVLITFLAWASSWAMYHPAGRVISAPVEPPCWQVSGQPPKAASHGTRSMVAYMQSLSSTLQVPGDGVGAGAGVGVGVGAGVRHSSLGRHNMIGPFFWFAPLTVLIPRAVYSGNSRTTVVVLSSGSTILHKDFSSLEEKQHSRNVLSNHANKKRVVLELPTTGYIKLHS